MIERLVYVSEAAPGVGARDAYDIIRQSHNRNSALGLTGGLILLDGCFLQVLEGAGYRVRERFARIAADPRHRAVTLRDLRAVPAPAFPGDWMALRHDEEIPAALRQRFGYALGFPASRMDGDSLVAFALACCNAARQEAAAG